MGCEKLIESMWMEGLKFKRNQKVIKSVNEIQQKLAFFKLTNVNKNTLKS